VTADTIRASDPVSSRPSQLPRSPLSATATNTRVLRTFAFLDLCGFTDFADHHGDDEAVVELRALRCAVREVAPLTGVRIDKWLGDGVMLVGVQCEPIVVSVLTIRQRLVETARLPMRAGIAQGQVILMEGDDYVGRAVNIAARLCDVARPGRVVASADHLVTPNWVAVTPLDQSWLKGISGPVSTGALDIDVQAQWPAASSQRPPTSPTRW
jgi:adenylate cyclase